MYDLEYVCMYLIFTGLCLTDFVFVLFPHSIWIVFTNFILGLSDSGDLGSHYFLLCHNSISTFILFIRLSLYFILTLAFLPFIYLPIIFIHFIFLSCFPSLLLMFFHSFYLYMLFIYSLLLISILSSFLFISLP